MGLLHNSPTSFPAPKVMLSSSQGHSLLKEESSGSHRAPYEVASLFTTYVKISESCIGAKYFNPNILVSRETMEVLIKVLIWERTSLVVVQAHQLIFKIIWIF